MNSGLLDTVAGVVLAAVLALIGFVGRSLIAKLQLLSEQIAKNDDAIAAVAQTVGDNARILSQHVAAVETVGHEHPKDKRRN